MADFITGVEKVPVRAARRTNGRLDCGHDAAPRPALRDGVRTSLKCWRSRRVGNAPVSSDQPGIPAKATHHLFTRRVGSPGYGEAALRAKRELPLLCKGIDCRGTQSAAKPSLWSTRPC